MGPNLRLSNCLYHHLYAWGGHITLGAQFRRRLPRPGAGKAAQATYDTHAVTRYVHHMHQRFTCTLNDIFATAYELLSACWWLLILFGHLSYYLYDGCVYFSAQSGGCTCTEYCQVGSVLAWLHALDVSNIPVCTYLYYSTQVRIQHTITGHKGPSAAFPGRPTTLARRHRTTPRFIADPGLSLHLPETPIVHGIHPRSHRTIRRAETSLWGSDRRPPFRSTEEASQLAPTLGLNFCWRPLFHHLGAGTSDVIAISCMKHSA